MPAKRPSDVLLAPVLASGAMRALDRTLRTVAPKEVTITLSGESGTGKEILARRIHDLSGRRRGPFVPINCAAIPEALFESELFGHERGAFTGAVDRARGKIEAAQGGTLFLDEIGEMPMAVQAKLLRFLENRRFMRVGGSTKIDADVRLVCATLRPLADDVKAGRFRADLHYRIQGITLRVPPLRERRADILPLVKQLTAQLSAQHGTEVPRFSRTAIAAMVSHDWPGNVRELRNTIELVCILRAGKLVRLRDLPEAIQEGVAGRDGAPRAAAGQPATITVSLDEPLEHAVDRIIAAAIDAEGGNKERAAARLGVSVRTIQRHLARGLAR